MEMVNSLQMLDSMMERSHEQMVILFKHSTRCLISIRVEEKEMRRVVEAFKSAAVVFGRILVVEDREVSLACANKLGIQHESPQVIILRNGKPIWHASHTSITYDNIVAIIT